MDDSSFGGSGSSTVVVCSSMRRHVTNLLVPLPPLVTADSSRISSSGGDWSCGSASHALHGSMIEWDVRRGVRPLVLDTMVVPHGALTGASIKNTLVRWCLENGFVTGVKNLVLTLIG